MALLRQAGVAFREINANEERELVQKFSIRQAPTLVLPMGDNCAKYRGVSEIRGWLTQRA